MSWQRFIAFFILVLGHSVSVGAQEPCEHELSALQKSACLSECEIYYQENPETRPASTRGVCESSKEFLTSTWSLERNKERFQSCSEGAWQGVLGIPVQMKAYLMMVGDLGTAIKDHTDKQQKFLRDCEGNAACRREVARPQARFRDRQPNGQYLVSDAALDREIEGQDFHSLYLISAEHQSQFARTCETQLRTINQQIENGPEFEGWEVSSLRERYRKITSWDAACPGALKMQFPEDPIKRNPGTGWLESLGIKWSCHSPEKVNELVCLEIAQFVLDPLAIGTGGAGLAAKASANAGLRSGPRSAETLVLQASRERRVTGGPRRVLDDPRAPPRDGYLDAHLNKNATTTAQNEEWIRLAENPGLAQNVRYAEVENSMMKSLNDNLKDKNLVTSLTNRHKELTLERIKELEAKNPGLEIVPYSDFKSVRFAFRGKVPENLESQVDLAFQSANAEFVKEVRDLKLVRDDDRPELWFRAGFDDSADGASAAARVARSQGSANRLMASSSPAVQARLQKDLATAENLRGNLERTWGRSPLMTGESGRRVPGRDAFDLVRKAKSAEDLASAVQSRYGLSQFSTTEAQRLMQYSDSVDAFSPSLRIAQREIVNLDEAVHGGFSADFLGLGSANSHATAAALAGEGQIKGALQSARQGERQVTQEFRSRLEAFRRAVGDTAKCSGDDCIGLATKPLTTDDKSQLLQRLAAQPETRSIRMSFIADGVRNPSHRTMLSTHGESIEKVLRTELRDVLPADRTDAMTFGIDMKTQSLNEGAVDVLIGTRPGVQVIPAEAQRIREALSRAVKKVNGQLGEEGASARYQAVP